MHRKSAATAIFQGEDGRFIGGSVLVMDGILEPGTVEAIACREELCPKHWGMDPR